MVNNKRQHNTINFQHLTTIIYTAQISSVHVYTKKKPKKNQGKSITLANNIFSQRYRSLPNATALSISITIFVSYPLFFEYRQDLPPDAEVF